MNEDFEQSIDTSLDHTINLAKGTNNQFGDLDPSDMAVIDTMSVNLSPEKIKMLEEQMKEHKFESLSDLNNLRVGIEQEKQGYDEQNEHSKFKKLEMFIPHDEDQRPAEILADQLIQ